MCMRAPSVFGKTLDLISLTDPVFLGAGRGRELCSCGSKSLGAEGMCTHRQVDVWNVSSCLVQREAVMLGEKDGLNSCTA